MLMFVWQLSEQSLPQLRPLEVGSGETAAFLELEDTTEGVAEAQLEPS